MTQATSDENSGEVRAVLTQALARLASSLESIRSPSSHQATAVADIRRWQADPTRNDYLTQVLHVAQRVTINEMMTQATSDENSGEVRAVLTQALARLASSLESIRSPSSHQATAVADIRRWQADPTRNAPAEALTMPPGDPI